MKFGVNVLHVNTHRLTESDFLVDVIISGQQSWHHFTKWHCVASKHLSVHAPMHSICQFLIYTSLRIFWCHKMMRMYKR